MPYKDPHSLAAIESSKRRCARWYMKNRDKKCANNRADYAANPEVERARNFRWRNTIKIESRCVNCGKPRDRGNKNLCSICAPLHALKCKAVHDCVRRAAFNAYGGPQCACCDTLVDQFLTIDHIHGGGSQQKRELGGGGIKLYMWLKRNHYPPGFQVLCMNCNFAKGKYGCCPHEKARLEIVA